MKSLLAFLLLRTAWASPWCATGIKMPDFREDGGQPSVEVKGGSIVSFVFCFCFLLLLFFFFFFFPGGAFGGGFKRKTEGILLFWRFSLFESTLGVQKRINPLSWDGCQLDRHQKEATSSQELAAVFLQTIDVLLQTKGPRCEAQGSLT